MNPSKEKPPLRGKGPKDYRRLYAIARHLQAFVRRSAEEVVLLLEAFCAQIEIHHEYRRWNRALLNKDIEG